MKYEVEITKQWVIRAVVEAEDEDDLTDKAIEFMDEGDYDNEDLELHYDVEVLE